MDRLCVPSPVEEGIEAPSKSVDNVAPNTRRCTLPITPVDSEHLSPYSSQTQVPVNPHTPVSSVYPPSDFGSECDSHYPLSNNGDDLGTISRSESKGNLAPPNYIPRWNWTRPHQNRDVNIRRGSTDSDANQARSRSVSGSSINSMLSWSSSSFYSPIERTKKDQGPETGPSHRRSNRIENSPVPSFHAPSEPNGRLRIGTEVGDSSQDSAISPLLPFPQITVSDWGRGKDPSTSNAMVLTPCSMDTDDTSRRQSDCSVLNLDGPTGEALQLLDVPGVSEGGSLITACNHHTPWAAARSPTETKSPNKQALNGMSQKTTQVVEEWLAESNEVYPIREGSIPPIASDDDAHEDNNVSSKKISLGNLTRNHTIPSQLYYNVKDQHISERDLEFMGSYRVWGDPPALHDISEPDDRIHQPSTSQAAIEKFQGMCDDNDPAVSIAALCGTRRCSLASSVDSHDIERGAFLSKMTPKGSNDGRSFIRRVFDFETPVKRPSVDEAESSSNTPGPPSRKRARTSDERSGERSVLGSEFYDMESCQACLLRDTACDQRLPSCSACEECDTTCIALIAVPRR